MGSKNGYYEYLYDFSALDENDIDISTYKSNHLTPGLKAFVFVIKTDFIVKARPGEPTPDLPLDSETFTAHIYPQENDERRNRFYISRRTGFRLVEYWMSHQEIRLFATNALAFADHMSKDPKYASASCPVAVLVRLSVCTLQQEGETFDAARQRAIRGNKLFPLYLWDDPALEELPGGKQISRKFKIFLMSLRRIRVEDAGQVVLGLMGFCLVCKQKPLLGDQISTLPHCNHAFHSHCIVRELVEDITCPRCATPAYPSKKPCVSFNCVSSQLPQIEASKCPSVVFSNLISSSKISESACEMAPGMKYLMLQMKFDCNKAIRSIQAEAIPQSQIAQGGEINNTSSLDGTISLISSEGETFKVDKAVALKSEVLKVIITKSSSSTCSIPLAAISSNILSKVIEIMNDEATVGAAKVDVEEFVSKFVKDFDLKMLSKLLKAASFLCIPFLPDLTSAVIADKLKQSTISEIHRDFILQMEH